MKDKWAVIGSNSFSGNAFVNYLMREDCEVLRIERPQYDLNKNMADIIGAIADMRPLYVVNFAAQSMVAESWVHPAAWMQTNAVAITELIHGLDTIRHPSMRYIHISTPEVYGSTGAALTEDAAYSPTTPYAASRAAGDMLIQAYVKAKDFPAITMRTVNVYGVGQQLYRIIPKTIMSILAGNKLTLDGGGVSTRSFIQIYDASAAVYLAATCGRLGEVYHSSTPRQTSIRDLVKMICDKMKVKFFDVVDIGPERAGKDMNYQLNSSKLRSETDWRDTVNLEQGVDEVIEWMTNNYAALSKQPQAYEFRP